jgi:hypothetical protein
VTRQAAVAAVAVVVLAGCGDSALHQDANRPDVMRIRDGHGVIAFFSIDRTPGCSGHGPQDALTNHFLSVSSQPSGLAQAPVPTPAPTPSSDADRARLVQEKASAAASDEARRGYSVFGTVSGYTGPGRYRVSGPTPGDTSVHLTGPHMDLLATSGSITVQADNAHRASGQLDATFPGGLRAEGPWSCTYYPD